MNTAKTKPSPRLSGPQSRRVMDYIDTNLDCKLSIDDLADLVRVSTRHFFRCFLNTFGTTPHRYVMNERVARAKQLLVRGQLLGEIAVTVGFANQSHFSGVFRKATGVSPNRFRQDKAVPAVERTNCG
jgi:AraC family transcriptional regulator